MKKTHLLLLLLFMLYTAPLAATKTHLEWEVVPPFPPSEIHPEWEYINAFETEWLRKVCTQGPDTVYIVGEKGLIARSPDRASSWTKQYPVTEQLNDIIFCNHTTGFAVGNRGVILKTSDAGETWTKKPNDILYNLNALTYDSSDNIWIVGDAGTILFSSDSGETFQKLNSPTTENLHDIEFYQTDAYIAGDKKVVYKSVNGGNSWEQEVLNIASLEEFYDNIYQFRKTANYTYILIGKKEISTTIFKKADKTWEKEGFCANSFDLSPHDVVYGISPVMATNGGQMFIFLNDTTDYTIFLFSSWELPIDLNHSDITVKNDTTIYVLSGSVLLRRPKEKLNGRNELVIQNGSSIELRQAADNTLRVQAPESKEITICQILDLTGNIRLTIHPKQKKSEILIDLSDLPQTIYLIRAFFSDNKYATKKFVRP